MPAPSANRNRASADEEGVFISDDALQENAQQGGRRLLGAAQVCASFGVLGLPAADHLSPGLQSPTSFSLKGLQIRTFVVQLMEEQSANRAGYASHFGQSHGTYSQSHHQGAAPVWRRAAARCVCLPLRL